MFQDKPGEAYDFLRPLPQQFPSNATICYDLAQAAIKCDRLPEACQWLYQAIMLKGYLKQKALMSPGFAKIRKAIESMDPDDNNLDQAAN